MCASHRLIFAQPLRHPVRDTPTREKASIPPSIIMKAGAFSRKWGIFWRFSEIVLQS